MNRNMIHGNRPVKRRNELISDKVENPDCIGVLLVILRPACVAGRLFRGVPCTVELTASIAIGGVFVVPRYGVY